IVEDQDLDQIRNIWFVDPDSNFSTLFTQGAPVSTDGGSRIASETFPVNPVVIGTLSEPAEHRLTVVIADGEFTRGPSGENDATLPLPPKPLSDGGTFTDTAYTDSFTWIVTSKANNSLGCPH